ncbi:MAG: PAS domain-containing protein [Helicobacteraceae bacterium]|nr:PAS domain-containing protein [Helicobacteraceae bacterium]
MEKERKVTDFLVSKTDTKGKITYCNAAFIEISGYKEKELLGKAHSIVRHKDMPRSVFKFLWDEIMQKREVNVYVKNRTKDGEFYWVFANVTPSVDVKNNIIGFHSVRRKPNPQGLEKIQELYKALREAEASGGIKAGEALFKEHFATSQDYNSFVLELQVKRGE